MFIYMKKSLEELEVIDRKTCRHNLPRDETGEPWFLYLRDVTSHKLDSEQKRLEVKFKRIKVNAQGCRESSVTHALSQPCLAKDDACRHQPAKLKNKRRE
jgi:hypothetical protein